MLGHCESSRPILKTDQSIKPRVNPGQYGGLSRNNFMKRILYKIYSPKVVYYILKKYSTNTILHSKITRMMWPYRKRAIRQVLKGKVKVLCLPYYRTVVGKIYFAFLSIPLYPKE